MSLFVLCGPAAAQDAPPTERFVVLFEGAGQDLRRLRDAIASNAAADRAAGIVAGLDASARSSHAEFAARVAELGGRIDMHWWIVDGCAVTLPRGQREALAALPGVARITADRAFAPTSAATGLLPIRTSTDAQHHAADALQAAGMFGQGAVLACLDSGQDSALAGSNPPRPHRTYYARGNLAAAGQGIGGSRLRANVKVGAQPADDVTGHGTAMAAIAAGGDWGTFAAGTGSSDHGHAPEAAMVGYAIADLPNGTTTSTTLISAWQQVVADKATYGTSVVLNAYEGSPDPTDPVQQALDNAVLVADLLVCVPAGNGGASTQQSQSAANGLAVGACEAQKTVLGSSSRGPLQGEPQRSYPDLAAHGEQVVTAQADDEQRDRVETGTSPAAAQVAGAALLYRSLKPSASALETKAAILASTADISAQNPGGGRNTFGAGYLRDDALADLARGRGFVANASLGYQTRKLTYRVPFTPGVRATLALVWHRHQIGTREWSDFDLVVRNGAQVVASSTSRRNLWERVEFTPTAALLEVDVIATFADCPTTDFSLVGKGPQTTTPEVQTTFGPGCKGNCPNVNPRGDKLAGVMVGTPTWYGVRVTPTATVTTDGFWICTAAPSNATPILNGGLWLSGPGTGGPEPVGAPLATGAYQVPVDATPAWHKIILSGTVTLTPSNSYFVMFESHPDMVLPLLVTAPSTANHVRGPTSGGPWTHGSGFWAVQLYCEDASGDVDIGFESLPYAGLPFTPTLSYGRRQAPVTLALGLSRTQAGGLMLPFHLGLIGAPTCNLYTSIDIAAPTATDLDGRARLTVPMPSDPGVLGAVFYAQWICFDQGANRLGIVVTSALACRVGG
jgi:hypothetical protein